MKNSSFIPSYKKFVSEFLRRRVKRVAFEIIFSRRENEANIFPLKARNSGYISTKIKN